MITYDMVVVGGGAAGLVTSAGAAGIGARVALIERDRLGGECLWTGCVPSKALLAAARTAHEARTGHRRGVRASGVEVDFAGVMDYVRDAQARIEPHDSPERFRSLGVDVIIGDGRFSGERTLEVDGRTIRARHVVIATGSRPAVPPIPGLDSTPYFTNESIFALERQPETLLVLGGGPIGVELAQAFARLGTRVVLLESGDSLLSHEDGELAGSLAEVLSAEGIELALGARVERATVDSGRVVLTARSPDGGQRSWTGDALLVATGREPRLDTLDLPRGGVEVRNGRLVVDDRLRTSARRVWAAGDVVGPLRFTHVADYQARMVLRNAFFPFPRPVDYSVVPWVTFTDPELARVGLTEEEARKRNGNAVEVWRRGFDKLDRAITEGHPVGLVKLVTGKGGKILGGHVLGHGAGQLIAEIALAMKHGISASKLADTIHAYPTYPEAVKQAADAYRLAQFGTLARSMARWFARRG